MFLKAGRSTVQSFLLGNVNNIWQTCNIYELARLSFECFCQNALGLFRIAVGKQTWIDLLGMALWKMLSSAATVV